MGRPATRVAALGLGLLWVLSPAVATEPPPAQGRFLVAAREMVDPNFSESVVLLLSHGDGGAMGLIVNRPTVVLPEQAIPDVAGLRDYSGPLFLGGPVQLHAVTFLVRRTTELEGGERVLPGVQYAADAGLLEELTTEPIDAATLRIFVGYAGWAPGQLEGEIARGGWHVLPADADTVFADDPSAVWQRLLPLPEPLSASARPVPGPQGANGLQGTILGVGTAPGVPPRSHLRRAKSDVRDGLFHTSSGGNDVFANSHSGIDRSRADRRWRRGSDHGPRE